MNGAATPQHFSTQRPGGVSMQRPMMGQQQMGNFQPSNPYWQPQAIPAPQVPQSLLQYTPLPAPSPQPSQAQLDQQYYQSLNPNEQQWLAVNN